MSRLKKEIWLKKTGEGSIILKYQKMSQEFLDAGYQEIMDERLAAFEAGNTTRLPDSAK